MGVGGERGSIAMEVSTDFYIGESREGVVLENSTDRHIKWLELGSGGVQSIHCSIKNPLAHPVPCTPMPYLLSSERVHL